MASVTSTRCNLGICLGCLATDCKMYSIRSSGMQKSYERLSGLYLEGTSCMPDQLCWQCAAYIFKFRVFRDRCLDASIALQNIRGAKGKVTVESVQRAYGSGLSVLATNAAVSMVIISSPPPEPRPDEREQNGTSAVEALNEVLNEEKFEVEYLEEFSETEEIKEITEITKNRPTTNTVKRIRNKRMKVSKDIPQPKGDGPFQCDECNVSFTSCLQLTTHKARQHSTGQHRTANLKVVDELHQRKREHKMLQTSIDLKRRKINIHATEINLTQEQIWAEMAARRDCEEYASALYRCDQCFKTFASDRTHARHMRHHDPVSGEFQCDTCKIRYPTHRALAKHVKGNHWRQWRCKLCTHVASTRNVAITHYRWHAGAKYECPRCYKSFE